VPKGRDKRPAFDALCRDATKRQFDRVMAWSVDRLGRSLKDLVAFLSELHALRIDLFLHQQGLDPRTPAGKAMFQMMGVFAEFERAIIQERVRAGLARAKSEGKRLGRPRIATEMEERIKMSLATPGRPVYALLPNSSVSIPARCSGSAALSKAAQAWSQCSALN
jgi:DNA invertase Pin-like site-specific DNA recombinase